MKATQWGQGNKWSNQIKSAHNEKRKSIRSDQFEVKKKKTKMQQKNSLIKSKVSWPKNEAEQRRRERKRRKKETKENSQTGSQQMKEMPCRCQTDVILPVYWYCCKIPCHNRILSLSLSLLPLCLSVCLSLSLA